MHKILLVEDSDIDRLIAGRLLQKDGGFDVAFAANGRLALEGIRKSLPDVVVTDLQMPEMNGLELVEAVRREFPSVPVVLMTYRGSEDIASEALRRGAASYVPKQCLAEKLRETVKRIVASIEVDRGRSRLMNSLERTECCFCLRANPDLIEPLVIHVQDLLCCQSRHNDVERLRLGLALKHALWIAHYHGNLEIPVEGQFSDDVLQALVRERQDQAPFNTRSLSVNIHITTDQSTFLIRHDGQAIDVSHLPDLQSSVSASHSWLSGFVFIASVVTEVRYDANTIELRHAPTS